MGLGHQMLGDGVRGAHTPVPLSSTSQVGDPVTTENKSLSANSPSAPRPSCGGQQAGALLVPRRVEPAPGAPPSARVLTGMGLARPALGYLSSRGPASQPQGQTDRGAETLSPQPPLGGPPPVPGGPVDFAHTAVSHSSHAHSSRGSRPWVPTSWLRVPRQALALPASGPCC